MAHGGKRANSGRKKGARTDVKARSIAERVLSKINEEETWYWVIKTAKMRYDTKTVADVMKYLTDRRDGKPRQAIEATGPGGGAIQINILSKIPRPEHASAADND